MPFDEEPPAVIAENSKSCFRNLSFAIQELKRLEKLQCVKQVSREDCKVIMPFTVVYSNKLRLVMEVSRHINPFVTKCKVKLDSLEDFAFMVKEGDFVAVDDLDLGYWHVPLHPSQSSLFGVSIYDQVEKKILFYH